ncbi:hypothetical protein Taro_046355 [Colocasia esculenta]
MLIKI